MHLTCYDRAEAEISLFCLLLNKVEFTTSNLKCQQLCKKASIRMLISCQRLSYITHYLSIIYPADFMHQRFKLTSSTLSQVRSLNFLSTEVTFIKKWNASREQTTPQPSQHMKQRGFKMVPSQRTWITLLGFPSFYKSLTESHTSQAVSVSWYSFPRISSLPQTYFFIVANWQVVAGFFPCQAYVLVKITICHIKRASPAS